MRKLVLGLALFALATSTPASAYEVNFGSSWSNVSLQDVLDMEYGAGVLDVNSYFGSNPIDPEVPYWFDSSIGGLLFREIAGFEGRNTMGWHLEDGTMPSIDGVDDGVIFSGGHTDGSTVSINLPRRMQFGLWFAPNGDGDSHNAPAGEIFFTNRFYNDIGPSGDGTTFHGPYDGDPQALIYNLTPFNRGIPTFVVAWEDLDYGGEITLQYNTLGTDNDFTDMVVEIQAFSPVKEKASSFGQIKSLFRN